MLLKHMLLSHHGQYEYGSPKRPKTLEAVILNFVDDLDSKINGVCTHMAKEPDREGSWTSYHRLYDRYFFKGFATRPRCRGPLPSPLPLKSHAAIQGAGTGRGRQDPVQQALHEQLRGTRLTCFLAGR